METSEVKKEVIPMNPQEINYLIKFCAENNFTLSLEGEVGFGRSCVGIMNPTSECYIGYEVLDEKTYETIAQSTVAQRNAPENAYHKGPYFAVLVSDEETRNARISELYNWIKAINDGGFKIIEVEERDSLSVLLNKGKPVMQRYIVDKD